jgi:hypothetical protein
VAPNTPSFDVFFIFIFIFIFFKKKKKKRGDLSGHYYPGFIRWSPPPAIHGKQVGLAAGIVLHAGMQNASSEAESGPSIGKKRGNDLS